MGKTSFLFRIKMKNKWESYVIQPSQVWASTNATKSSIFNNLSVYTPPSLSWFQVLFLSIGNKILSSHMT